MNLFRIFLPALFALGLILSSPSFAGSARSERKSFKFMVYKEYGVNSGYIESWKRGISAAVDEWNKSVGYVIFKEGDESSSLKIFINDSNGAYNGRGIAGLYIFFNCKKQSMELYKAEGIEKQVALHEFGHAIGLDHSDKQNDIMYYIARREITSLSENDIIEAKKLIYDICK